MDRDPADFAGNPNPPPKAPDAPKVSTDTAAPASSSSAGTGALPPGNNSRAGEVDSLSAPASTSSHDYTISGDNIYLWGKNGGEKVGTVTLPPEDAEKLLKGSSALHDENRGVYDQVPEDVVKTLASGKPSFTQELESRFSAGEAQLHTAAMYDAALMGLMSFGEARERVDPDLVKTQLANYPGTAWKGLGDVMTKFHDHPLDETEDILRQSVMKTAEALPSIAGVGVSAAVGAGAGYLAGGGAGAKAGAKIGTFGSLMAMEAGGSAAELHQTGYQDKTIREIAPVAGAVKAALWMYGVESMTTMARAGFLTKLATSEEAQKTVGSWAYNYALNAGIKLPSLMAAQEGVAHLTNNLAALIDKRPDLMRSSQDGINKMVQAAFSGGEMGLIAGIPGAAMERFNAGKDVALAKEVDAKLEGVERREPLASSAPLAPNENSSNVETPPRVGQTASSEPTLEKPQAPLENQTAPSGETKASLESIKDHPAFVKAQEEAKDVLPEGVKADDPKGVIEAYKQSAKDAHDYANMATKLTLDGEHPPSPDEENQITAKIDDLAERMGKLRELATFLRDPDAKAKYEDWKAGGQEGARPPLPIDPYNEELQAQATGGASQKLEETLANKEAKPDEVIDQLNAALKEESPRDRLNEKVKNTEVKMRLTELNDNLKTLRQRIGEVASTRDRMVRNGLATGTIDRQLNKMLDNAVASQKEIENLDRRGMMEEKNPRAKLQATPATLEQIVDIGFKEGGKQSQVRARELLGIAKENGLTVTDVKKLIGNKAIGAMGDVAYKNFLEGFEHEGEKTPGFKEGVQQLVERKQARAELASVIRDRQIEKEQYVRRLNNLPSFNKMSTQQLKDYADILRQYDRADVALSPKRIEALKGTMLEGVKTEGEARAKAAQLTGSPVEDFQNVRVPLKARTIPDPQLRTWFPALRPFVDLAGEMSEKGDRLADVVKERNNELATAAIRERRGAQSLAARLGDWFAPQQREVMAYLEAKEPADVATAAANLTPAELKWGDFLKSWFGGAEDYLVKKEGLESRFSGAYAPHVNRGWPEILHDVKEQGLWASAKEFLPQANQKGGDFVDNQGNILGFNKFFKQSLYRSGELVPSKNVVAAANQYMTDFYRKSALDQIAPVLDTLARAMKAPEEGTGFHPKENEAMTSSLQDFVKAYVNNKKGINNSAGAVGEFFAPALRFSQNAAAFHWIAANYALQAIKGSVAIPVSEYMALGTDLFKAKALKYLPTADGVQARAILDKYESFTGKSPWAEIKQPGADAADFAKAITYGGFGMAHKAAMEDILLGSMTKDEFAKGEISDARLNQIRQEAGRWLDLSRSDSIMGSSAVGKTFTQYKSWAIPPTLTLAEDATALAKQAMGKGKMTDQQVREVMRLATLGTAAAVTTHYVTKDMEDGSFTGQAIHYLRRAVGSVWRGLDPAFFFSAAGPGYVVKLASDLHLLGTLEEYKSGEHEGELKGKVQLAKDLEPRFVKDIATAVEGE